MSPKEIRIEDFNYDLPNERIAFFPKDVRDSSKLLVYRKSTDTITDSTFDRLPEFLDSDMMLVFNDSRVIHARLLVQNPTGAETLPSLAAMTGLMEKIAKTPTRAIAISIPIARAISLPLNTLFTILEIPTFEVTSNTCSMLITP